MSAKSISQCKGKGSIGHNNREFFTDNIDRSRTSENIVFVNQPIGEAYTELFGESVKRYNDKQKRNDRKIGDYYESLFNRPPCNTVQVSSCKRKSFYEDLVQVGDKDDCGCTTPNGELAVKCLTEYMNDFHKRNLNFHVFNAILHVDEATPHLHINYIPMGHYKRGMDTQNGYNQALKEMGFVGADCFRDWRERERRVLRDICKAHGLEIKPTEEEKGRGHSFTVEEYKDLKEEIKELRAEKSDVDRDLENVWADFGELETKIDQRREKLENELETLKTEVEEFRAKSKDVRQGKDIMLDEKINIDDLSNELGEYLKNPVKMPFYKKNIEDIFIGMKKILHKAHNRQEKAASTAFIALETKEKALKANKNLAIAANRVPELEKEIESWKVKVSELNQAVNLYKDIRAKTGEFLDQKGIKKECNDFINALREQEKSAKEAELAKKSEKPPKRGRSR